MKKKQILIIIFGLIVFTQYCHAMLAIPEKKFTTKTGKVCILSVAKTESETATVNNFLEVFFESIISTPEYHNMCVYIYNEKGKKLIAAAHFLLPNKSKPYVFIADMAVGTKFQNDGIGGALLGHLIEHAPYQIRLYSLDTAIGFYKKFGFYSDSEDLPQKMQRDYIPTTVTLTTTHTG